MKIKNVLSIIFLVIFFLFSNQAWAADWIYFDTAAVGDVYYDKSSIVKVSENIISVWNKDVLSEKTKKKYFSLLKEIHKAPKNPSMLNYYTKLMEIDCVNKKIKDVSIIFYNDKGKVVYASPKSESGEWNDILPNTVGEKLISIVSCEAITPAVTPNEVVVAPKIEEPVAPKEVVVAPKIEEPVAPKEVVVAPKIEEPVAPKEVVVAPKIEEPVAPKEVVVAPKVEEPVTPKEAVVASKVEEHATPKEAVVAASPLSAAYSGHVASFKSEDKAVTFVNKMKAKGLVAFYQKENVPGKGELYKSYIGRYETRQLAYNALIKLMNSGEIDYFRIQKIAEKNGEIVTKKMGSVVQKNEPTQKPETKTAPSIDSQGYYEGIKGIVLKNGKVIKGQIISIDDNNVLKIRTKEGEILSYSFVKEVKEYITE
jgi:cell division septation protein DedD